MSRRILISASHPEETRVVVVSGNRLEEFDFENTARSQLKGNIYLAKITRVEPSLQAAFVEYGGNRHGFLPFSEIHSDYYRIPVADRKALAAEEAAQRGSGAGDEDDDEEAEAERDAANGADGDGTVVSAGQDAGEGGPAPGAKGEEEPERPEPEGRVDILGGDEIEDDQRRRASLLRRYKIQEVIKRRQIILVQVSKEERGTKGAALTSYLSLAGRYCVLMPNTARGGGISRKIAHTADRRRLKSILSELDIPEGMAVIVRTAGSQRTKVEIRRDYDYLLRLWSEIRETTLKSTAPCLIYEEANLIKRTIRDLYARDMEDVLVEGEASYKATKEFMRALIPSHARKVKQYKDPTAPLFHQFKIEGQLDAIHNPIVQLRAGGYIVLNQTEALVAIDVNSGKATKERHIEETALKTNLEAAEEVARQLRLRDLAGLVVIDFIDMEEARHNREVERKLKEAMRDDRARIQLGRISPFGLLELSRQRLRPSLFETSSDMCPRCGGTGHVRSIGASALIVLRALEEEGLRCREVELRVSLPTPVALQVLNQLRDRLIEIERRYAFKVHIETDDDLIAPDYRLVRLTEGVAQAEEARASEEEAGQRRRRRPRRRRDEDEESATASEAAARLPEAVAEASEPEELVADHVEAGSEEPRKTRRRRGKRGGRKRARRRTEAAETTGAETTGPETTAPESPMEPALVEDPASAEQPVIIDLPAPAAAPEADGATTGVATSEPRPVEPRRARRRVPKGPRPGPAIREDESAALPASDPDGMVAPPAEGETAAAAEPAPRTPIAAVQLVPDAPAVPETRIPIARGPAEDAAGPPAASDEKVPAAVAPAQDDGSPPAAPEAPDMGLPVEKPKPPKRRGWWNRLV